jgi:hypothetical protein
MIMNVWIPSKLHWRLSVLLLPILKGRVAFHAQILADSNTIIEIAEKFLAQQSW